MKKLQFVFAAITLLAASNVQASKLVLDSFNYSPALSLEATPDDILTVANESVDMGTVTSTETGALAAYTLTWLSGAAVDTAKGNNFGSGLLAYGEEPGADGTLEVAYTLPGGATLDFSGYSDFFFDVLSIDGSGGFDVMLTLVDDDGTTISASYNVSTVGTYLAALSAMGAGPGFDWTKVASATAFISSVGDGDDFSLDAVGLVPEPSMLALLGLGLVGLGIRRRKLV